MSSTDLIAARGRRWRHRSQDKSDDEEGSCDSIKNTESKKSVTTSVYSGDFTDCGSDRNINTSKDSYDTDWEASEDNEHNKEVNAEELKSTGSRKSVTTSNVYSTDFTDYSSEKHNSSGKETYVIDWDDSEDSEASCQLQSERHQHDSPEENSIDDKDNKKDNELVQVHQKFSNKVSVTSQICTMVGQESFTQTSKTIIELAESEGLIVKSVDLNTLQTQTSYISVTENKRIEYKIHNANMLEYKDFNGDVSNSDTIWPDLNNSFEDKSIKRHEPEFDVEKVESDNIDVAEDTENKTDINEELDNSYKVIEDVDKSVSTSSDIDDDSLMEYDRSNKVKDDSFSSKDNGEYFAPKSISKEIEDLYMNVSKRFDVFSDKCHVDTQSQSPWARVLTPLTEESANKDSIIDMTPCLDNLPAKKKNRKREFNVRSKEHEFAASEAVSDKMEAFKLPPIENSKASNLCYLLSAHQGRKTKNIASTKDIVNSECKSNNLAAGESSIVNQTQPRLPNQAVQLPPINSEPGIYSIYNNNGSYSSCSSRISVSKPESLCDSISIQDKIGELKTIDRRMIISGSISPLSTSVPECGKSIETSYKGCELLSSELMRKLKSSSWCEVVETLEEIPKAMDKFWNVITELRIADFIRQVTVHVDSPRSQVARTACLTLASILKNTNYTKKPDFYEAVTALLVKTGCFSKPVRRAANMALDEIVCAVDFTQTVTALCAHGVGHKSPLVRCAAARLLVVCCAVSGGGRGLLRGRPASAAAARRSALRALAELLQDKATDARKYAERLYSMLRPLSNFEAYFLTDVDVELASRQMKKYDRLLTTGGQDR